MINLRSDTVTQPTKEMRHYMASAPVGDDSYGEDPSVNLLQNYCKELFGKEDCLFVTSGMMANRLAFMSQTSPGDEVITENHYHVNFFDSAPMAAFAGIVMNPRHTKDGILRVQDIEEAVCNKQRYKYFAQPKLVSIENSINGHSGKIFPFAEMQSLHAYANHRGIRLHLDGARLFNAHVETGISLSAYAKQVDTLSVCFAKGLAAPYGSVLMGSKETIDEARRYRLWLGGGIHQGGIVAAGAYFALLHHIQDLKEDHEKAKQFAKEISQLEEVILLSSVETNIVQFSVFSNTSYSDAFHQKCESEGLLLFPWIPNVFRAVFHRDISHSDVLKAISIIKKSLQSISKT